MLNQKLCWYLVLLNISFYASFGHSQRKQIAYAELHIHRGQRLFQLIVFVFFLNSVPVFSFILFYCILFRCPLRSVPMCVVVAILPVMRRHHFERTTGKSFSLIIIFKYIIDLCWLIWWSNWLIELTTTTTTTFQLI